MYSKKSQIRWGLLAVGLGFIGCSKTVSSSAPNTWFVVGNTAHYTGTETVVVTIPSPTPSSPNSSASYTFSEIATVKSAVATSGSPAAALDLNRVTNYTVVTAASSGTQPSISTSDTLLNTTLNSDGTQSIEVMQTLSSVTGTNIGASGGIAPYFYTSNSTTTFITPQLKVTYPLVTGATWSLKNAYSQSSSIQTVDANNTNISGSQSNGTYQNDGSYSLVQQNESGTTATFTQVSDGSGTQINSNKSAGSNTVLNWAFSVPVVSNGTFTIPVTTTTASNTTKNYSAADWYLGNTVPSPLGTNTATVVGPATALPAQCNYSGANQPNLFERDSSSSLLDTVRGTYTVSNSQVFDSNGLTVCELQVTSETYYDGLTGLLTKTVVSTTTTSLSQ